MASIARASYRLFVSWEAYNLGLLTFDYSTFDGVDAFGVSPLDVSFSGTYDNVSAAFDRATVSRGRSDNLETMLAGEATIDLRDPTGLFNPNDTAGPLYASLDDRLHPVKLEAVRAGVTYPLFYGWTRRFAWEPHGRRGITQLECVDLFYWLDRAFPIIASTGATTVGAAIGLILDDVGLTDPALRDLDAGQALADYSADGTRSARELVEELLEFERGVFYAAGDGAATFRDRYSRLLEASTGTIANRMTALAPGVDFDRALTRVTVRRSQNGYVAAAESDAATKGRLGNADLPQIETRFAANDSAADELAAWILPLVEEPLPPIYGFSIDDREADLLTHVLARELVDRVTVSEAVGGTGGDFHIDRLTHTISTQPRRHSADWLLSRASARSPIVFDSALFDGTPVFV